LHDILGAFVAQGYSIVEGPEVELDYYNFEALRIPKDHPARELMDTFYIDRSDDTDTKLLLRTHTSPNQVRFMEAHQPPIRIVVPGKTYRNEATDPTHEWMIFQVEVLAVERGLTMAHLKGTLFEFAKRLFGRELVETTAPLAARHPHPSPKASLRPHASLWPGTCSSFLE